MIDIGRFNLGTFGVQSPGAVSIAVIKSEVT